MKSALDFLKNRYVKKYNIWERFFKPLIVDPVRWEELLTSFIANRNHVAHNKLLDYLSKETMLSDTREFRRFIREAVIKFEEENSSEEVEETLQAIADQREYEQEARMEIIESESGVKIRDRKEILKLFQDTVDDLYTDAVNKVYFDEGIEVLGECKLQDTVDEQLLFSITGRSGKKLEIYGVTVVFDDREAEYDFSQLTELELAYAMTVHKSQGSEYRAVILAAWNGSPYLLSRSVLYTAVTRARELLIIAGREEVVVTMTNNAKRSRRYSGLKLRLQGKGA